MGERWDYSEGGMCSSLFYEEHNTVDYEPAAAAFAGCKTRMQSDI